MLYDHTKKVLRNNDSLEPLISFLDKVNKSTQKNKDIHFLSEINRVARFKRKY
jgi:hypothetical protein